MSKQLTTTSEIIEWINTRTEQLTNKLCNIQTHIDEKDDIGENTGELWQDYDKTDAQSAILIELLNKIAPDQKSATKCPRCGEHTLKMPLSTNALSRHIPGAYVCDLCSTKEAIEDFNNAKTGNDPKARKNMSFNKYLDYVEGQISNNPQLTPDQILACVYDSTKIGEPDVLNDIRAFYADLAFRPDDAGLDWVYDLISEYRTPTAIPEAAIFKKISFEEFKQSIINDVCSDPENEDCPLPDDENLRKLYDNIPLPVIKTGNSAGHDFATPFAFALEHGRQIVIPTGIRCLIKKGHVLKIYPRSGLGTKYRCQINNTVGIIDMDYYFSDNEGHIKIKLTNDSKPAKTMYLNAGDTFCQGIVSEYKVAKNGVSNNIRNGGWGSTSCVKKD